MRVVQLVRLMLSTEDVRLAITQHANGVSYREGLPLIPVDGASIKVNADWSAQVDYDVTIDV